MDELVRWLGEQLDEEAELAASGESWSMFPEGDFGTPRVDVDYSIERVVAATRAWRAKHVALHDPARVLREIDADRRLIDDYVTAREAVDAVAHPDMYDVGRAQGLEEAVRYRALRFAERSGYLDEWKP